MHDTELRERILDAAEATKLPDGSAAFASVVNEAALPDAFPALIITLEDARIEDAPRASLPATFSGEAAIQGIIYVPTSTVDLDTEQNTTYTTEDARRLFLAFLHELYDEATDPMQPAPGLNVTLERVQVGQRSVQGQSMHAIGFALSGPAQYTPSTLESFPADSN